MRITYIQMMNDHLDLTEEQVRHLIFHWENLRFDTDFDFNYENQMLNGAVALTEGKIELLKDSILQEVIMPGSVIGLASLMNNKKVKYQMRIKAGSRIVLIGKSGLNDLNNLIGKNGKK